MTNSEPKNTLLYLLILPVIVIPILTMVFLFVRGDAAEQSYARALERAAAGDYAAAFEDFKRAGEMGHAEAYCNLGLFYLHGIGCEAMPELGRDYLELAELNGSVQADFELGFLHENAENPDYAAAALYYRRAALAGHVEGLKAMGRLHNLGLGTNESPVLAAEFYRKAADSGDAEAMTELGKILLSDELGGADYAEAKRFFERAAALNYPGALTGLGYLAELESPEHAADLPGAERFYRQAAQLGDAEGMVNLGDLCRRTGREAEAMDFYRKAAERNFAPAWNRLGTAAMAGDAPDYAAAREFFEKAGKAGSAAGYLNWGILLETGRGGDADFTAAQKAYWKAQQLGSQDAAGRLSELEKKLKK